LSGFHDSRQPMSARTSGVCFWGMFCSVPADCPEAGVFCAGCAFAGFFARAAFALRRFFTAARRVFGGTAPLSSAATGLAASICARDMERGFTGSGRPLSTKSGGESRAYPALGTQCRQLKAMLTTQHAALSTWSDFRIFLCTRRAKT
jgi:hypothetical protein